LKNVVNLEEKLRARQFWMRFLLVVGLLWGFLPFVTVPFISKGPGDTGFDIFASVLNSLTVMPACALAFWHRRTACAWLSVNAVVLGVALATFMRRTGQYETAMIAEVAGPIVIALCLDVAEMLKWPAALSTPKRRSQPR
jgi:hypothetical protein